MLVHKSEGGFTLVEIAVVLLIVGMLLGGIVGSATVLTRLDKENSTEEILEDALLALTGYAASQATPYLPCPDTDGDGIENRAGTACTADEGRLPWVTLGLGNVDAWAHHIRYRADPIFSDTAGFTLLSIGGLSVCSESTCVNPLLAQALPVVLVSHGSNGFGAFTPSGGTNAAPTGADEIENTDGDVTFVFHNRVEVGGTGGEFDDILVWLSPHKLKAQMIEVGAL